MRQFLVVAIVVLALASQAPAQQVGFPYTGIVLNSGAKVHSGPGLSHYATHELKENDVVEVHRHDPGGWCAIRPPAKSFSLIPESSVKVLGKDADGREVAEVLADGSQAWVGTVLGPVEKPLWQVKLKKGERVSIVGQASWPHSSGKSVVWYQVEPPAGEYRWIRLADLQLPPDEDGSQETDYSEPPEFPKVKQSKLESRTSKPQIPQSTFKSELVSKSTSSGWKAATRPIPKARPAVEYSGTFRRAETIPDRVSDFEIDSRVEPASFQEDESSDPRFEPWDGSAIPASDNRTAPPQRFASLESMNRQTRSLVRERNAPKSVNAVDDGPGKSSVLMDIEEQLSSEILKEPQSWNLTELKFQTERAKARSSDPVERMALQHVLEKIARCDDLRKGYQQASPLSTPAVNPVTAVPQDQNYDASGWLTKLASSSGSIDPVYVLQDSLGNVTHHVAGTTGMNLSQYVDKQVGVIGRRGFNRRLNLDHVTADRVIVLR